MKRTFEVISEQKHGSLVYSIVTKQKGEKQKSQKVTRFSGYETEGFANADVVELGKHLEDGKRRLESFVANFNGSNLSKKQKVLADKGTLVKIPCQQRRLTGNALSRRTKGLKIKYQM